MMTIAQDLGDVLRLLEKATPGEWTVGQFGSVHRPKVEGSESSVGSAIVVGGSKSGMYDGYQENCEAIAAAVNFLRAHSAEIAGALRDAEKWQPIESAPNGAWFLAHSERGWIGLARRADPDYAPGEGWFEDEHTEYLNPAWLTHWRPLPAPPTQDSAMQQGGGGGDHA